MHYQVTKKRLKIASLLALGAVLLIGIHLDIFTEETTGQFQDSAMGLLLLLLLVGCYVQSIEVQMRPKVNLVWILASFLVTPFVMVFVIEFLSGHDMAQLPIIRLVLNCFWCQIVYVLLFACTNHYRWSMILGSIIYFFIGAVNHFVQLFRGSPFQISDILSLGTAADVAGAYTIAADYDLLFAGSITFLAVSLAVLADFHQKRRSWKSAIASVTLLTYVVVFTSCFYQDKFWNQYHLVIDYWNPLMSYNNNGTMLSLAMGAKTMAPEKPETYSATQVKAHVQQVLEEGNASISDLGMGVKLLNTSGSSVRYFTPKVQSSQLTAGDNTTEKTISIPTKKPNIIAIMNESYADLSVLGDFSTTVPVMEFYHSLNKNTIKGNLSVSTLGGGTCNTEFEFLTGLSMAFLPSGVMAYSKYINGDMESMASILNEQGYTSIAFHPGKATSWDRHKIYPRFGFESFYTAEDMEEPVYMRDAYISDSSDYAYIMQLFEEKETEEPLFLFNVTIQNHGGYMLDTVGIPKWVAMHGEYRKYTQAEEYLSLIRASDKALEELITYFQQIDEPTMVIFFGDHQPTVESAFIEDLMGKSLSSLRMEEVQKRYTVPFFIWANYDIEEAYYENISVNYLSTLAMEVAGIELPVYNQYLSKLYQTLPVVNALGYADQDGTYHYFSEENEYTAYVDGYELVQYDYLFGKRNRVNELYHVQLDESTENE